MTMRQFLKENRDEITRAIVAAYGENCKPTNDSEREDWILNDEGLYTWAKSEGVKV